mgnify:CR=1 FL=1
MGDGTRVEGVKFRDNAELMKQHFAPKTKKDDFIDHLLDIWKRFDEEKDKWQNRL